MVKLTHVETCIAKTILAVREGMSVEDIYANLVHTEGLSRHNAYIAYTAAKLLFAESMKAETGMVGAITN